MKKQVKSKFLSLLLSVAMILGCSVPALAAEDVQPESNPPAVTEEVEITDLQEVSEEAGLTDLQIPSEEEETTDLQEASEEEETTELRMSEEMMQSLTKAGVSYKDGVYEGTGKGFGNGAINLEVTITDGKISKVELVSQQKQSYWNSKNVASLFDDIVEANSPEVSAISGATESSNGVKEAVRNALSKAEVTDSSEEDKVFDSGSGTKQNPYLIKTVDQLQAFAKSVNGGESYQGKYISLNNDLDLEGVDWTPIGASSAFKGTFDGVQYTISNLKFGTKAEPAELENVGLFGDLGAGGVIRNVGVKDAVVYNTYQGSQNIGLIVAGTSSNTVVENCWATGDITSKGNTTDDGRYSYIGGLVGSIGVKSLIANSWADVTIASSSGTENSVGGIVGSTGNNSLVINCAAFGTIGDTSDGRVSGTGGVVGYSAGAVYACYSDTTLYRGQQSWSDDGSDVSIGGVVGGNPSAGAAYSCYFNADAKQSYYGGDVSEPVAVGACDGYASDSGNCEGLSASEIKGDVILDNMNTALTEDQLAAGQTWLAKNVFSSDSGVTLDTFLSKTEGGWNGWEKGENGRILPTGASSVTPEEPDYFDSGDGSKADPYVISSEENLRKFAAATVSGKHTTTGKYYKLGDNIALNGAWTPIHSFAGSFDGDNHTISDMTIGTEADPVNKTEVGFFDNLQEGASVQNLNITGATVYTKTSGKLDNTAGGVLAGAVKSAKIDNCTVQGSMVSVDAGNFAYVGGLFGKIEGDTFVTNCIADVPVKAVSATNAVFAGGLLGNARNSNLVANCAALGNVTANGVNSSNNKCTVGGLIGYASFLVENCYAAGNVTLSYTGNDTYYIGALIGKQGGGVAVDSHYDKDCVLTVNGTQAETVAAIGEVKKWDYADKNKVTAEDTDEEAFAATMNNGISEDALAETDKYLTTYPFNYTTNIFADVIAARKGINLNSWALTGGKVVFGDANAEPSGTGTEEDPYIIKTEAQLRAFAAATAENDYSGKYVELGANITLTSEWTPIHAFAGNFDGKNYTVSGLKIGTAPAPKELANAGFFDYLADGAKVSNLKLTGVAIYVQTTGYDRCFAGALVGGANSIGRNVTIDHCSATGSAVSVKSESYSFAGGLIGQLANDAVVTNCWTDIPVSAIVPDTVSMGTAQAGGLIAGNSRNGMIANCAALGNVTASGVNYNANMSSFAGGLGGQLSGIIQNCYAAGDLSLTNKTKATTPCIGGLVGQASGVVAVDSYYNSKATATVNGETVALEAIGKNTNSDTKNVSSKTTGTTSFAATMNSGLSKAGMAAADEWLIENLSNTTQVELNAMRPAVWYGWTLQNDKVLLSAKAYEEPKDPVDVFDSGSGTAADPWIIKTADQWSKFAESFSETDYAGKYIALGDDFTLNKDQAPAGNTEKGLQTFKGVLDGQGHTISGLEIGSASAPFKDSKYQMYFGLFAELENATVKNLGVKDAKIYVTSDVSVMAGPLAGFMENATVDGCWATGTVVVRTTTSEMEEYNSYAGGLVGYSQYSNIVNSWTNTAVDAYCKTANAEAGGIAGLTSFGLVANCYTLGDVSGETDRTVDDGGVAYLGGIAGCQASTVVNCYTTSNATARSWTQYVGAIAGMATAVSKTYDSYYSENVELKIEGETVNPPVALGRMVPLGYNENGEFMSGALADGLEALPALNTKTLADKLNANFNNFPADVNTLGLTLKQWVVNSNNLVTFGTNDANVTYVPIAPPKQDVEYKDGIYYGRDKGENVIVTVTVKDGKITSAVIDSPKGFDAANANEILAAVVKDQEVKNATSGTDDDKALKGALIVALNKALLGDTSGYGAADPEKIFDGGEGTAANPYQIRTAEQLRAFAAAVNEDEHFDNEYIVLTADIDLAGEQWIPVGNAGAHYFGGIFDGKNHKISNMVIGTAEKPVDYVSSGLFACIDGAVVRNLGVKDASIVAKRTDSVATYGGIIAAVVDNSETGGGSLINNCTVSGSVSVSTMDQSYAGGIAGYTWHSIVTNCGADVKLTTASSGNSAYGGGLVALDGFSIIANSYALGTLTADAGVNAATIGGIAGMQAGVAGNNYADMTLKTNNTTADIGSLVGRNTGIAVLSYGYFNNEKKLQNGSKLQDAKDVGENVTMVINGYENTGEIKNTEGKTGAFLHSQELADLLIHNQCTEESLQSDLKNGISGYGIVLREGAKITIDTWKLDGTIVKQGNAPQLTGKNQNTGGGSSGGGGGSSASGSGKVTIDNTVGGTVTVSPKTPAKGDTVTITVTPDNGYENDKVTAKDSSGKQIPLTDEGDGKYSFIMPDGKVTIEASFIKSEQSDKNSFVDVPENAYYADAVDWAVSKGITSGTTATTFSPNASCTRAQMVTFLWRAAGSPKVSGSNPFSDVAANAYYYDAVLWAVQNGITSGTSATTFAPNATVTRGQTVAFLWRAAGSPKVSGSNPFSDVAANAYYYNAVLWAVQNGITSGTSATTFSPNTDCTRAQIVTFLFRSSQVK